MNLIRMLNSLYPNVYTEFMLASKANLISILQSLCSVKIVDSDSKRHKQYTVLL